ncbi:hypothetical protein HY504_01930 [Candidatus Wolfebacteria bacterium]|nr:hypothetical protein [Candidatus Wolfebacteria bacterium]
MLKKTTILGFTVSYEDNAREGVRYLRDDLDYRETKVFFDQAKSKGSAEFEDEYDRQFTLVYQRGLYVLMRRGKFSG